MNTTFLPPQAEIMEHGLLHSRYSCILQMPTGSGKTWLAEHAIEDVLRQGYRAVYLTPLRALATELADRWQKRFADHRVGIFTGDYGQPGRPYPVSFAEAQLLIMTPERFDACTRAWRARWHWLPQLSLAVVDEFHLLGERQRGARLEGALLRARRLNPFLRILALSATLGNRGELADWLDAVEYGSDWRPVPLSWRVVHFRKAAEKPDVLATEVHRGVKAGGRTLVFVQSRRRAEELARFLHNQGLQTEHHHAGLSHERRRQTEEAFRARELDALVATGTLEMGMNLPARQVILYDLQAFDGAEFTPLSTNRVWQRVGRAGRPGLDATGEAVLLAPSWARGAERYARGLFEPIRSNLRHPEMVAEQIVAEVSSGLARTTSQLRAALGASLAARQQTLPDVERTVQEMADAGMIVAKTEQITGQRIFSASRLGRIASRHFMTPATVLRLQKILQRMDDLTFFDLLLLTAVNPECEPVLPVDFEELDALSEHLAAEPTYLLQTEHIDARQGLDVGKRRLLAGLKMALVVRAWTRTGDASQVADEFDCYPFEISRLADSCQRLLAVLQAIAGGQAEEDEVDQRAADGFPPVQERIAALRAMVITGLDEVAVTLTGVPGLGATYARRLHAAGIEDIEDLAQSEPEDLVAVRGVSFLRAARWIDAATEAMSDRSAFRFRETAPTIRVQRTDWPVAVDPYRMSRAVELNVTCVDAVLYHVTGGLEPHRVKSAEDVWHCDCKDAERGHVCKHVLAVRLATADPEIRRLREHLGQNQQEEQIDLFELWFDRGHRSGHSARKITK